MDNTNQHTKMKIIDPEDVDFVSSPDYKIVQSDKKFILVHKDRPTVAVKPVIVCRGCTVKYAPEKYNKITIQLNQYDAMFFIEFSNKIEEIVEIEGFLKEECIGLKISPEQKEELKGVKRDAFCDVVFKFNDIWKVNGKMYASFVLEEFVLRAKAKYLV